MEGLRLGWTVKVIIILIIFTSVLFRCVSATNHSVGGAAGWDLTSDLQSWTASTTFYTGDLLVFSYGPTHDVLEVNRLDYDRCRSINPISSHNDGQTVVPLTETGSRYFICGRRGHCALGLKLGIQVLEAAAAPAPAPAPQNNATSISPPAPSNEKEGPSADPDVTVVVPPPHDEDDDQTIGSTPPSSAVGKLMMMRRWHGWLSLLLAAFHFHFHFQYAAGAEYNESLSAI